MNETSSSFKFVHTADLHLDSPLKSLARRQAGMAEAVRGASRQALSSIIDLCIDEQVNALLIAGDLYDGDQRSMSTAVFLREQLRRLQAHDIRVFVIRGNHDSKANNITSELALPDNVHVFDGRGSMVKLSEHEVAIHGTSFANPSAPDSLLPKYPDPVPDYINIGLLHTSLAGDGAHDTYAPCSVTQLIDKGYDYWALGHIHKRMVHHPHAPAIVMPGNPQGRHMGECGPRSVSVVSINTDSVAINEHSVEQARFERIDLDVSNETDWQSMESKLEQRMAQCRQHVHIPTLILRVELLGETPLSWRIARDRDRLLAFSQSHAASLGDCWVEQIVDHTRSNDAIGASGETNSDSAELVDQLARLIDPALLESIEFQSLVDQEVSALLKKLPTELRACLGDDQESTRQSVAALLEDGTQRMLAQLHAS